MLSSPHLLYCNCVSVPVLHCSDAYAPWYCPLPTTASEYGTCFDNAPTHRELNNVHGEPSAEESTTSRRLKFGIENILYGRPSRTDHISVHERFPSNQELSFIARQPFPSPVRTSTRPWCRPVFTQLQRRGLEKRFQITKYVTKRERLQIGAMLGLSETQVKVWFQNRRTKWRHEAAKKEEKQKEEALKEAKEVQEKEEVANSEEEKEGKDALTDLCSSTTKESPKILKKD